MKKIAFKIALGALLIASSPVMAQQGEPVLASVTYEFTHVNDLNNPDKPIKMDMRLHLGQSSSRYISLAFENSIIASKKAMVSTGPRRVAAGMPMALVSVQSISSEELFQYPKENKLTIAATIGNQDYLIEDKLPKIDWKISKETKTIGTYSCQKAVGKYAGRIYTAWFAPDLPFQDGPWKLSGLPGLILEATDAKNEVMFLFKDISKTPTEGLVASGRSKTVKATPQAFARAKEAFDQNPTASLQAQLPANAPAVQTAFQDGSGKVTTGDDAKMLIDKKKKEDNLKKNNPLELVKQS